MHEKGLTNARLADAVGISASMVSDIRNNKDRGISCYTYARIARFLGVSLDYLMGISDSRFIEEKPAVVVETTGLSSKAVDVLIHLLDEEGLCTNIGHEALQFFLESGERGIDLLSVVYMYLMDSYDCVRIEGQLIPISNVGMPMETFSWSETPGTVYDRRLSKEMVANAELLEITTRIKQWREELHKEVEG